MSTEKTCYVRPQVFGTLLHRFGLREFWPGKPGDSFTIFCLPEPVDNAAEIFHKERGCCDGTNPSECFRQRKAAEEKAIEDEKETRRLVRIKNNKPRSEFEGTE